MPLRALLAALPLGPLSEVTSGTYDQTFDRALASSCNPAFVTAQGSLSNAVNTLLAGLAAPRRRRTRLCLEQGNPRT